LPDPNAAEPEAKTWRTVLQVIEIEIEIEIESSPGNGNDNDNDNDILTYVTTAGKFKPTVLGLPSTNL
jgi:hypothetical protein